MTLQIFRLSHVATMLLLPLHLLSPAKKKTVGEHLVSQAETDTVTWKEFRIGQPCWMRSSEFDSSHKIPILQAKPRVNYASPSTSTSTPSSTSSKKKRSRDPYCHLEGCFSYEFRLRRA
ncbi:hypothetical protein V2J09_001458 [Rumex salicifolius]